MRAECERLSRRNANKAEVSVDPIPNDIPRETALCLFRVVQEAFQNVIRHTNARRGEVVLRGLDGRIQLAAQDDGKGFDPEGQRQRPHLGLVGVQERVHWLDGRLDIKSSHGNGSVIESRLPLGGTLGYFRGPSRVLVPLPATGFPRARAKPSFTDPGVAPCGLRP